jgi:DNA-binding transcriptional regulator YiaG
MISGPIRGGTVRPVNGTAPDPVEVAAARAMIESGAARRVRLAAHLSLAEVARSVGVTAATVYRWEADGMKPRGEAAVRYGRLLRRLMGGSHDG